MREPIVFRLPESVCECHIIQKRGYTGKGYRYSLKIFNMYEVEIYYHESFKTSKTQISDKKLIELALKHLSDMEVI